MGDAPWPPHYQKQENEPPRVMPSKRRQSATKKAAATKRAGTKSGAGKPARDPDSD
jgi:hypothetical protein